MVMLAIVEGNERLFLVGLGLCMMIDLVEL
jgi:hypothetical protein